MPNLWVELTIGLISSAYTSTQQAPSITNVDFADAGWYYVTVTVNNCSNIDSVEVLVTDIVADFDVDVSSGCAPHTVTFTNTSNNSSNCAWDFGDGNTGTGCGSVSHTYQNGGTYDVSLTVSDGGGCSNTLTYLDTIRVEALPVADFTPSPSTLSTFSQVSTMTNNSSGASTYSWEFPDGSTSTETNPTVNFNLQQGASADILLIASSTGGCLDSTYRTVTVQTDIVYFVPNTFTPDEDPFNRYFTPVITSGIDKSSYNLKIFDRWGGKIFESSDVAIGWDGSYLNIGCAVGVYTYVITFIEEETDKKHKITGQVSLLR